MNFLTFGNFSNFVAAFTKYVISRLVELYIDDNTIPPEVQQVFCIDDDDDNNNSQLNEKRKLTVEQYIRLIKSIPLILIISALGIISVPVQLDNLTKYKNSQGSEINISWLFVW